jgi:putative addiction module component (TIGR02574 family)
MSTAAVQRLREEAMKLADTDRADLADLLWSSVTNQAAIDAAWNTELVHRVAELDAGRRKAIPAETVFAEPRRIIEHYKK